MLITVLHVVEGLKSELSKEYGLMEYLSNYGATCDSEHGAGIAKGLRGCCTILAVPILAVCSGVCISAVAGILVGIFGGIISGFVLAIIMNVVINKAAKGLTVADCFIPLGLSIVFGFAFMPISFLSASVFSVATCIYSGILMTLTLFAYKSKKIGAGLLVMPFCVWMYELLPLELPSDMDNILALSGNTLNYFVVLSSCRKALPDKRVEDGVYCTRCF